MKLDRNEESDFLERRLIDWLLADQDAAEDLRLIRDEGPSGAWLSAGYIRNLVWDRLHGYAQRNPIDDADVIYYDSGQPDEDAEKLWESKLASQRGGLRWSCKNQARMHVVGGQPPYADVADAMSCWPETATAVAAAMREDGSIAVLAPHGLEDLFGLVLRRSPRLADAALFSRRIEAKQWMDIWPRLIRAD